MFMELIRSRRSIRRYKRQPLEPWQIDRLVEAALRAPSSRGLNPWELVVVRDRRVLGELARAKPHGASFLEAAPLAIVVCADARTSDVWIEDASIVSTLILLTAHSLDLGACWIQIRNRPHDDARSAESCVRGVLGLPESLSVLSIVAVGGTDEHKPPHPAGELDYGKVHDGEYGAPWSAKGEGA